MRNAFIDTVLDSCGRRDDIFIVSGDAGLGVFDDFRKTYPSKFLNLGIAEQNASSFSAGLSLTGHKVYLYNIIPFVLYRCYEQVRNDICYQKANVVLVGIGSGVTYAPQGMTHYSAEDLGLARTLPNLKVLSPIDPVEARSAALYSLETEGPVYVRLAKRGEPRIHKKESVDVTSPLLIQEGEKIAVIFHGSIGTEVIKARQILDGRGISPKLISLPMVQPIDIDKLFAMLKGVDDVVSVEEHYVNTGLGSILSVEHSKRRPAWNLHSLGIQYKFIHEIKDTDGMRELFGISGRKIAEYLEDLGKRKRGG